MIQTAAAVDKLIAGMKAAGRDPQEIAWEAAKACAGWAYVFGATGQYCTPTNRRSFYASKGADHPTIKSKCANFEGTGSCSGCKWFPDGGKTRFYDCRGFTRWILIQAYGWTLQGGGCTSQWNTKANWKAKGLVADGIPKDTLVCLFYYEKGSTKVMAHTGLGQNGETVECGSGVQYSKTMDAKWTHWGIPSCVDGEIPEADPGQAPAPATQQTLRRGDRGEPVKELQQKLQERGYDLGPCGVDGIYGQATQKAVTQFQKDWGLAADGIAGPLTWGVLNQAPAMAATFTVTISGMSKDDAEELCKTYPDAKMKKE